MLRSIRPKRAKNTQAAAIGELSYERPAIRSAASYWSPTTGDGLRFQDAKGCLKPCSSPVRPGRKPEHVSPNPGDPPA
jgi:hypothetical protein